MIDVDAVDPAVNHTDARLWHPWLRINRVLRVMLHTHWSAEAWSQVRVEFKRALALRSEIGGRGGSTEEGMMRLGRKAALLVAFSPLTSAATAHAECAWVLFRTELG